MSPVCFAVPVPLFAVWTDFGPKLGQGFQGDATMYLDEAADRYVEAREEGQPAVVWRLDPAQGSMTDVTHDAERRIRQWLLDRHDDVPAWLATAPIAAE